MDESREQDCVDALLDGYPACRRSGSHRCLVVGILNVTPDSFSDGGKFLNPDDAIRRAMEMVKEGADVIDIGGESTRPGSQGVCPSVQVQRVVPVIRGLRAAGLKVPLSIDTRSAEVASVALVAGANIVNDVSGACHDPAMPRLLAERGVPFIIMHMQGTPESMQQAPRYNDVVSDILRFFEERSKCLATAGVDLSRMIVDPGIGFGKTTQHNLEILRRIGEFRARHLVMVGPSRKRFLGELLGNADPDVRMIGTAAVVAHCALAGVSMVRVHDVREMRQVVEVCSMLGEPTAQSAAR